MLSVKIHEWNISFTFQNSFLLQLCQVDPTLLLFFVVKLDIIYLKIKIQKTKLGYFRKKVKVGIFGIIYHQHWFLCWGFSYTLVNLLFICVIFFSTGFFPWPLITIFLFTLLYINLRDYEDLFGPHHQKHCSFSRYPWQILGGNITFS